MSQPPPKRRYTVAEYFALEEKALEKHEFHEGEIVPVACGTIEHSGIITNVLGELRARLKGKPCRPYDGSLRIRVGPGERLVYADAQVICGEPEVDPDDERRTTVVNPRVVIEVPADATEAYDRGEKFALYRALSSVQEYVLISQDRPTVEVFSRLPDGLWCLKVADGIDVAARLESLGIDLPLAEVYAGVSLPLEPPADGRGVIVPVRR